MSSGRDAGSDGATRADAATGSDGPVDLRRSGDAATDPSDAGDGAALDDSLAPDLPAEAGLADAATVDSLSGEASIGDGEVGDSAGNASCGRLRCGSTQICVQDQSFLSNYHCESIPSGCEHDRTCACMGSTLCTGAFNLCQDEPNGDGIICHCPAC